MHGAFTFTADSLVDTNRLGRALGKVAEPGLVIALIGPMGAGKTTFTRAVAEGMGIADTRTVSSPTFLLIQEYDGRLPLYHFDTYRLRSPDDFLDLGVEEYFFGNGICLVEWADRVLDDLPNQRVNVRLTPLASDEQKRVFTIEAIGTKWQNLVQRWRDAATEEL